MDSKLEDQRFCTEWQQAIPQFNLLLISSWIEFWFVKVVSKYLNSSSFAKELFSLFILWLYPAFWSRDMITYLVLSFTSSPVSLLATKRASAYSFIVCTLPSNILTSVILHWLLFRTACTLRYAKFCAFQKRITQE